MNTTMNKLTEIVKSLFLLMIVALAVSSCSKSKETPVTCIITSLSNGTYPVEFTYTTDGKWSGLTYSTPTNTNTQSVTYDQQGRPTVFYMLSSGNSSKSYKFNLIYTGAQITSAVDSLSDPGTIVTATFGYNTAGQLTTVTNGSRNLQFVYPSTSSKNPRAIVDSIYGEQDISYDTNGNPFLPIMPPVLAFLEQTFGIFPYGSTGILSATNNVLVYSQAGLPLYSFKYVYGDHGYPISQQVTSAGSVVVTYNFAYTNCK